MHRRLNALFDRVLTALDRRHLAPVVLYAQEVHRSGSARASIFPRSKRRSTPSRKRPGCACSGESSRPSLASLLGLVSTILGAAKDAVARRYISLAAHTHARSLDLRALFTGLDEP